MLCGFYTCEEYRMKKLWAALLSTAMIAMPLATVSTSVEAKPAKTSKAKAKKAKKAKTAKQAPAA